MVSIGRSSCLAPGLESQHFFPYCLHFAALFEPHSYSGATGLTGWQSHGAAITELASPHSTVALRLATL